MNMNGSRYALLIALTFMFDVSTAVALTINLHYVPAGQSYFGPEVGEFFNFDFPPGDLVFRNHIPGSTPTEEPPNIVGGGDLTTIMETAAQLWENRVNDDRTFHIAYGWANLSGSALGHSSILGTHFQGGDYSKGWVRFDSDTSLGDQYTWYADQTPLSNEEYEFPNLTLTADDERLDTLSLSDYFIGDVPPKLNVYSGSVASRESEVSGWYDMLTVALHEIGHNLGLRFETPLSDLETADGDVDIRPGLVGGAEFAALVDDLLSDHLTWPQALMYPIRHTGERVRISDLDLLTVASVAGFNDINLLSPLDSLPGDFNEDGSLGIADIELLFAAARVGLDISFDLTGEGTVDSADVAFWVNDLRGTWFGDANLDGEFNTGDLVDVFQAGHYEDGVALNSTWSEGDWNGDGDFDTGDLVTAFQNGGFEAGPRVASTVPEPSSMMFLAIIGLFSRYRWRK